MTLFGRPWAAILATALSMILGWRSDAALLHPPVNAVAVVRITADGEMTIDLTHDALAFALNDTSQNIPDPPMFELLNGPDETLAASLEEAGRRFERLCVLTVDGARTPVTTTTTPTVAEVRAWQRSHKTFPLPVKLALLAKAKLPAGHAMQVRFPEMLGDLLLVVERPEQEMIAFPLTANELSPTLTLPPRPQNETPAPPPAAEPTAPAVAEKNSSAQTQAETSPTTAPAPSTSAAPDEDLGSFAVFERFVAQGFRHIIPQGVDHCLFVLGLFLISPRLRPVLIQISAFTIAHTVTLTLTSFNLIGLPGNIVEPVIAASIAFVGIENLISKKVDGKRTAVAFVFGLLHGMGVATAFSEVGFPEGKLIPSLAAFTIGVEGGHLAVLAAAFLTLGWFRDKPWYRTRVAIPLSILISLIALYWFFERIGWIG